MPDIICEENTQARFSQAFTLLLVAALPIRIYDKGSKNYANTILEDALPKKIMVVEDQYRSILVLRVGALADATACGCHCD